MSNTSNVFGEPKDKEFCKGCYYADKLMSASDTDALVELMGRLWVALESMLPESDAKAKALDAMHDMIDYACQAVNTETKE